MKGIKHLFFLSALVYCASSLAADELPVESFSQLPSYMSPTLSPSGNRIAYIANFQSPEIALLAIVDLNTGDKKHVVKSDNLESKINWFHWANEKTIIVSIRFANMRNRTDTTETRLLAIDVDADQPVQRNLIRDRGDAKHFSQFQDTIVSFLPHDPEHILIALDLDVPNLPGVYKLNIYTKRKSRISKGKMNVRAWMADRQGKLRLGEAVSYKTGEASTRVRIGDDMKWHKVFEYNALEEPGINPLGFALDSNILYYSAYSSDKKALYKIHLESRRYVNSKFVKRQIGDDSDDLETRSPFYQAEKITIPMLLLHGSEDRVVDVAQSRDFAEALEYLDKDVEYIELENGDHYLSIQANRHATFKAMDRFLKLHLGGSNK